MRYLSALALVVVVVFLVGTNSIEVFAKRPSNPPELEQRVTDLEGKVADHESRIGDLETNDAAQDDQLADHENRIIGLEQQAPAIPGIKAYDANDQFLGILLGHTFPGYSWLSESIQIFIPSLKHYTLIKKTSGDFQDQNVYFESDDCSGTPYVGNYVDYIFRGSSTERFFVSIYVNKNTSFRSRTYLGECEQIDEIWRRYECIEIPKEDIPFTLPVTLPFKYEYP